jgi:hypothetical protein
MKASRNQMEGRFAGKNAGKAVRDKLMILPGTQSVLSFGDIGKRRKVRKAHKIADKHHKGW